MKYLQNWKFAVIAILIWLLISSVPSEIKAGYINVPKSKQITSYSLSIEVSQTTIESSITVNWTAPEQHSANDYVRLAKVTDSNSTYSWSQTLGAASSGSFNVTVPNTVARYEFRLFNSTNNQRITQSSSFVVNKTNFSISSSPLTIASGGQITVDWTAPLTRPVTDLLVITSANSTSTISQKYTSGVNPQTAKMSAPLQIGQYEIRYLEAGATQPSAISQIFTVEASDGTFVGQVKQGETGEYINGAVVEVLQNNTVKASSTTNSNGSYAIPLITAGTYDIKVSANGFPPVTKSGLILTSGGTTVADFDLYSTGILAGKITKNGISIPVSGANIQIKQGAITVRTGNTDLAGNYSFANLPTGSYSAEVSAGGYAPLTQNNISINAGETTSLDLNLTLNQPGSSNDLEYIYDSAGRLVATKEQGAIKNIYNYDSAGNLISITSPQGNAPAIISFSPGTGTVGTQVIIQGINFSEVSGENIVSFNGVSATVTSFTDSEIITSVPSGAATGNISVTTPNGSATSSLPFIIGGDTGNSAPVITSFSPQIGHPGDIVTINGSNFESEPSDNSVMFGATGTGVISGTTSSLLVQANTSSGKVSVTTPNGTGVSSGEFVSVPDTVDTSKVIYAGKTWFGNHKSISIPTTDKRAVVTFDGVAGRRFSVQFFNLSNSIKVEIYRPDGRTLTNAGFNTFTQPPDLFIDTQTFPLTGTYTMLITPTGSNTAPTIFNMVVYDVPPDILDEIQVYGYKQVWIGTPGQNASLNFYAEAGQKILMNIEDSTFTGSVAVKKYVVNNTGGSSSTQVLGYSFSLGKINFSPDGMTIPSTGTYSIFLDPKGSSTGPMKASLRFVPPDPVFSMNIGESETFATTQEGQNAWIQFSGNAGQRISLQVRDVNYAGGFDISLNKPDGTFLATPIQANNGTFIDTLTLPVTGIYKILVNPYGYNTGSTTIDLFDVPPDVVVSTTINGSPVTVNTAVPGHNPSVTFDALAGQQARVNITNTYLSNATQIRLKKPDGSSLATSSVNAGTGLIGSTTLPVAGTYTVELNPTGANQGSATISVGGDVFGTVTPDSNSTTVTIDNSGQSAWLSFNGTAGQKVSLKLTDVTFGSGTVSFRNPDGSLLGTALQIGTYNNFLDTVTLPTNGVYKVLVDPSSSNTGSATLTLYNVPSDAAGTIAIGGNAETRSVTVPGQNLLLSLSGTANQKFSLEVTNLAISGSPRITVKKPDGTTLVSTSVGSNTTIFSNTVLPQTGAYGIFVDPTNDNTGSITLQFYGTGTGSPNPTAQLINAVSVQKGLQPNTNSSISASVSVKKGFDYGGSSSSQLSNSVSVRLGNLQNQLLSSSVSVSTGPVITGVSPSQAVKGNTITLTVSGNNLSGASAVRFYKTDGNLDSGFTVSNISVNSEGTVLTATVQISSGAEIGDRVVIVATPLFGLTTRENIQINVITITQ